MKSRFPPGETAFRIAAVVFLAALTTVVLWKWPGRGARLFSAAKPESRASPAAAGNRAPVPAGPVAATTNTTITAHNSHTNLSPEFDVQINPYAAGLREPGRSKRSWPIDFLKQRDDAKAEGPIQFELTDGIMASGTVKIIRRDLDGITYLSGELTAPEQGKFFFLRPPAGGKAGAAVGVIEFPASKTAYRIEPTGENNAPELWRRRLDEVLCLNMPAIRGARLSSAAAATPVSAAAAEDSRAPSIEEAPPLRPDQSPGSAPAYNSDLNGTPIISLQSLPGTKAVVLLDFFGGSTPTWGGVTWPAPNLDNARIKDIWKRVAEDYMPFNINVTTDIKVYQSAPASSRQRCVFTPGTASNPLNAGGAGVAYLGSWNWGSDTPCWDGYGYSDAKGGSEVAAHEVGHTVGLGHQTQELPPTNHVEYFSGQGTGATGWAPIMGAGYYDPVTTWAKGEFQYAGNTNDALNTITTANNNVAYRADDGGGTLAAARYLEIYTNFAASAEGVIETTADTDAYQFTTSGGAVSLSANPVGDWANLAVMATLADASDTIIASNNPQTVLSASISTNLLAGTYTFRVTGAGRNDPLTSGFSSYASLGYYSITGSVAGARLPNRFTVAERSPNGTIVGTVTSTNLGVDTLNYAIAGGNSNTAFALDNNGVLTVANSLALNYANLAYNTQLNVQFELFVNITDLTNSSRTELNRRVVVQVIDVPEPATRLVHRWSFNDGTDSVGGANATLVGSASYSGGKLQIPGGSPRANGATVNITNTLGTNISLTVEGWFTMNSLQNWSKVWMFGRPNGGTEPGLSYVDFTPRAGDSGNVPSMSLNTGLQAAEVNTRTGDNPAVLSTGIEYHAACVYDSVSNLMTLYINGVPVDSAVMNVANITQLQATEAWFGASVYWSDNNLNGAINEMRIYNGPVAPEQIAINYAAGPNNVVTNPGVVVRLRMVTPSTNLLSLSTQSITVFADYANITNVNVTSAGVICTSGNSNIITSPSPGLIRGIVSGTTTLMASFGGTNVSRAFTVTNAPLTLAHRWSFNDGTDSIGGSNATLVGTASYSGGQLQLPGGGARANCASVNLAGTLNTTVSLTVESWFTMSALQNWAKVWMFGTPWNGAGEPWLAYAEFTPRAGAGGNVPSMSFDPANGSTEVNTRGGTDPALLTNGVEYCVVASYDAATNLMSLYINGTLADSASMGGGNITQLNPTEGYFGSPVSFNDPCLAGSINEMRVWKGVLSPSQIAFDASAGPDTFIANPGPLTAVRLVVTNSSMPRGSTQPTSVFADFANYPNLNVGNGPGVTYTSSSSAIVTVSSSGVLTAMGAGMTTVTASYGGVNGSQTIIVGSPVLKHRWSFNDGTDSVGGANATLVGSASYSGGKLQIPGGSPRVNAATVNITNTLASNPSITIEGWFTMNSLQNWSKVWMFGTPKGGTQPGLSYVDFTPRRGDGTSVPSISLDTASSTEVNTAGGSNPAVMSAGVEYYAAAVYHAVSNTMYLYVNGAVADSASMNGGNITQLQATEAWFGASVYWSDNNLNGAINELRIWDGPLSAAQITNNYQLGPNILSRPVLAGKIAGAGASNAVLTWSAVSGLVYQVQYKDDLRASNWVALGYVTASGNTATFTDTTGPHPARFYRLVVP